LYLSRAHGLEAHATGGFPSAKADPTKVMRMSFDLYLMPEAGFWKWNEQQWAEYWKTSPEYQQLGNSRYIGLVEEMIVRHLESGKAGSRFPLLMGRSTNDMVGWSAGEMSALGEELRRVSEELTTIPINVSTLLMDDEEEVKQLILRLRGKDSDRRVTNLRELFYHYFEAFQGMIEKAKATSQGLWLSF
jgi:hypothetical protein